MSNPPINNLKKQYDILGAEGPILSLYVDTKNNHLYLSSFLSGTNGNVFYRTTRELLTEFIHSEITINQLLQNSPDIVVIRVFRRHTEKLLKDQFSYALFEGMKFYKDFSSNCKQKDFEVNFG